MLGVFCQKLIIFFLRGSNLRPSCVLVVFFDRAAKPVGARVVSQRLIPTGERSGFADAHSGDGQRFIMRADAMKS
jgi:hypothetical protein